MKKSVIWIVIIVIIVVIIALVYKGTKNPATSTNEESTATTSEPVAPVAPVPPVVVLGTASSTKLGSFLVASNGMTLYHFTKDSVGTTTCYGQCAALWPAYTAPTSASGFSGGVATGTVATITRADGTIQVTYNGVPLYFYSKDVKVGDTKGQNILKVWFVVKP